MTTASATRSQRAAGRRGSMTRTGCRGTGEPGSVERSAGDVDDLAGDEAGLLGHEEGDRRGDVLGLADPLRRGSADAECAMKSSNGTPIRSAVAAVMSVWMKPGATAFAVTPNLPSSMARVFVKPWRPALAAE